MSASAFLTDVVDALRAAGCAKAKVTFAGSAVSALEVEFHPGAVAPVAAGLVDGSGKPIDLDEGAGPLAKDPDEPPAPVLESSDAAIEHANFRKPKAA